MRTPSVGITPEGWPFIGLCAFSSCIFALVGCLFAACVFLVLTWFSAYFFRDPERVTPGAPDLAVSPADGKVIGIGPRKDPFTGEERTCIAIFMNVFSVHVNRSPVQAKVEAIRYYPGKFLNASFDKASTDNERCAYLLRDTDGETWIMVQIAGLIARRIVCRTDEGDRLARGQRYGLIRFGSRVDLFIPAGYTPACAVGDQVFAAQSIVARKMTLSRN
ncbi:MAG: phosphatidylserine decarboxylase family protein [Deltaproteobacteria bacterium]|jgi:phosphatidylserine decarboxylase|nr:phosphatidylserine decarboxylase family protein [Deltaproteobacteria bacterium]